MINGTNDSSIKIWKNKKLMGARTRLGQKWKHHAKLKKQNEKEMDYGLWMREKIWQCSRIIATNYYHGSHHRPLNSFILSPLIY